MVNTQTERRLAAIFIADVVGYSRLFADDFSRSPGHGLLAWDPAGEWQIGFSYDPNRVANQYGLVGRALDQPAVAIAKGPPWGGADRCEAVREAPGGAPLKPLSYRPTRPLPWR